MSSIAPVSSSTCPPAAPTAAAPTDRVRGLTDAARTIARDLSGPAVLRRIVRASCSLVGACCGALAVLGEDGALEQFVHHGIDDATVDRIAALTDPTDLPTVLTQDCGGHRGIHLDIPICIRGSVFGRLYLVGSVWGGFDRADTDLVTALAEMAGASIDNARLYEDAQRSKDWLHASGEIARALLADADADALMEVVSRALHVAEADYAALVLPTGDGLLKVAVALGVGAEYYRGRTFDPNGNGLAQAIVSGRSLLSADMQALAARDYANPFGYGPAMVAPLVDVKGVRGAVLLVRTADRVTFTAGDLDLATTFADQVALALQFNDARADTQSLHVLENRHEVCRALHDSVMQRLFATGMGLQGLVDRDVSPEFAERLRRHVHDLDETIDEIRARVFKAAASNADPDEPRFTRVPHVARMVRA